MRLITILLFLLSLSVHAETWVFTSDRALAYDKDSIVRSGAFSEVTIRGAGPFEMDCVNHAAMNRKSIQTVQAGWGDILPNGPVDEIFKVACSKVWEFWKR